MGALRKHCLAQRGEQNKGHVSNLFDFHTPSLVLKILHMLLFFCCYYFNSEELATGKRKKNPHTLTKCKRPV